MVTNFVKGSSIDIGQRLECASKCNSVKSYKSILV